MDRSFNQSLYQGLVDFIHNEKCDHCDPETGSDPKKQLIAKAFKPSQDNTTDFINTYVSAMKGYDVLGLAGFNHATPLNAMMIHKDKDDKTAEPLASNADPEINKIANSTAFVLLDSNVNSNQNVASVQFRADQPGFLAALAACQYLYNNLEVYHKNHEDLSVAAFGGVAIPTVTIYIGGFQRGVEFFNNKILLSAIEGRIRGSGGPYYYFAGVPEH
ncbi:MAG: BMP family ABC transporter substrate-binding protein [Mycoplasmoidaceae bacterium]|nr:BMP family ABC transporter substrate-binding protein [Mycoplasmoidaceae bacterium]